MRGVLKRVGIRYCGGCNPTYERVELVERLQVAVGGRISFFRHDEPQIEATLAVCGCPKACAAEGMASAGVPVLVVTADTDLEGLNRWLTQLAGPG